MLRSGARVEGPESEAAAAAILAHRRPLARIAEGVMARKAGATAAIDVSDGLSIDLHRLASASGVGFELDEVPVASAATRDEALGGGDDYELILATPDPEGLQRAFTGAGLRAPIVLGRCVADPKVRLLGGSPLALSGWEHQLGE
jgi:thiamine-monophosphate kinase